MKWQGIPERMAAALSGKKTTPATSDAAAPQQIRTVTVVGCSSAVSADGGMALILATKEVGSVAFKLDLDLVRTVAAEVATLVQRLTPATPPA
ncbi:MAG: hypothetical protein ACWA6X_01020 [Bauldia sp.]